MSVKFPFLFLPKYPIFLSKDTYPLYTIWMIHQGIQGNTFIQEVLLISLDSLQGSKDQ